MSSWNTELLPSWRPPRHTHSITSSHKSSGDNRTISQSMLKLTHTSTIKDQDIPTLDTTLIPQGNNMHLLNSSRPTAPTTGLNSSSDKTSGKPIKEAYTTAQTSAGGSYQTLSTQTTSFTNKRPAPLSLSQQLPQHFSSFLPAPTPQIIQPQWKDNRKKLTSLLAKPSKKHRESMSSPIPLTVLSKETLHLYSMETETKLPNSYSIGTYGHQSTETMMP